jgi:hypothetical protein
VRSPNKPYVKSHFVYRFTSLSLSPIMAHPAVLSSDSESDAPAPTVTSKPKPKPLARRGRDVSPVEPPPPRSRKSSAKQADKGTPHIISWPILIPSVRRQGEYHSPYSTTRKNEEGSCETEAPWRRRAQGEIRYASSTSWHPSFFSLLQALPMTSRKAKSPSRKTRALLHFPPRYVQSLIFPPDLIIS